MQDADLVPSGIEEPSKALRSLAALVLANDHSARYPLDPKVDGEIQPLREGFVN